MKRLILFCIILIYVQCARNSSFISDHVQRHLEEYIKQNGGSRQLIDKSQPYWPLRMEYRFIDDSDINKLKHVVDLLEISKSFFGKHLLVQGNYNNIKFSDTGLNYCFEYRISDQIANEVFDADIVFFVTMEQGNFLASAGPCAFDLLQARPIFGLIGFGNEIPLDGVIDDIQYEKNIETTIHEMFHGLGFISNLFNQFFDSATSQMYKKATQTLNGVIYLQTPRIVNYTRNQFDCASATGLPMEDQGGQGTQDSHFERRLFNNELMTGSDITGDFLLSIFSFKLLEDSGWYRLGQINPDPLKFGAYKGCDFLYNGCHKNTYPEFCYDITATPSCSFDRTGYGICSVDMLANNCLLVSVFKNFDCRDLENDIIATKDMKQILQDNLNVFDYDSICFDGSLSIKNTKIFTHSCHRFECSADMTQLTIQVGTEQFLCTESLQKFTSSLYDGQIICPINIWEECYGFAECPEQCNRRGFCMNKICHCMVGYSGASCSTVCNSYRYGQNCTNVCPPGTFTNQFTMTCLGCPFGCDVCLTVGLCTQCSYGYYLSVGFCERNFDIKLQEDITYKSTIQNMMTKKQIFGYNNGLIQTCISLLLITTFL